VPHAPERQPLVPVDQALRELIELLVLAPLDVEVDDAEASCSEQPRKLLPERRRDPPDLPEAGESKPLPWPSFFRITWYSQGDICSSMSS